MPTTTTRADGAGGRYEVQARRLVRRGRVVVSDDTRLAATTLYTDAVRTAAAWAADGFTVWIYLVRDGTGTSPTYQTVATLPPARSPGPAEGHDHRSGRSGPRDAVPTGNHPTPPTAATRPGKGSAA